jgi:putative restriction endonuclease
MQMSDLAEALGKVSGEHAVALEWFKEHTGKAVTWAEIKDHADKGARLVTQAKGIYKPHYTQYALSVRQTLDSPYADKEVELRADGSWVYPYFQENPDPKERDAEATNRGLVHCMTDAVPVGVLLQVKPKPGVEYAVLGLAMVRDWENGYFILEGFSDQGSLYSPKAETDAAYDRAVASTVSLPFEDFEPINVADLRKRQIAEIVRRKGQAKFRSALIAAYGGKCAITGCDALEALEAAHISPYKGDQSDHPQNGLLLRGDLHSLFDLGLLAIDPETLTVVLAPKLANTSYASLAGQAIRAAEHAALNPSASALYEHLKWAAI